MIYAVTARFIAEKSEEFLTRLTDGTIARQRPDGMEIVESMKRARVQEDGSVRWTESCFCAAPLRHERETQYDRFFSEIETRPVDAHAEFEGEPFMDYLTARTGTAD